MREYFLVFEETKKSNLNKKSNDFIDALDYFYYFLNGKDKSIKKEDKIFFETLEESSRKNKKLQEVIRILQKPSNSDDSTQSNLLSHKDMEIIYECIEIFKHFAKINKYSDNFNDISNLGVDEIKYDHKLLDLVLINPEDINNEELIKNLKR